MTLAFGYPAAGVTPTSGGQYPTECPRTPVQNPARVTMSIWHLKNCDVFASFPESGLSALEAATVVRRFPRTAYIYSPWEKRESVLVLLQGRVKLKTVSGSGKEVILGFVDQGELFGELVLFQDHSDPSEFAEATTECVVAAIPRDPFMEVLALSPKAALALTKVFGLRRVRIENRVKGMLFRSSRERLLHVLEDLAAHHGRPTGAGVEIEMKLSHQELAGLTGLSRETVTITLGELQRDRAIAVRRRSITLLPSPGSPLSETNGQASSKRLDHPSKERV